MPYVDKRASVCLSCAEKLIQDLVKTGLLRSKLIMDESRIKSDLDYQYRILNLANTESNQKLLTYALTNSMEAFFLKDEIIDFKVICNETNNTPEMVKKKEPIKVCVHFCLPDNSKHVYDR